MKKDIAVIGGLFLLIVFLLIFGRAYTSLVFLTESSGSAFSVSGGQKSTQVRIKDLNIDATLANNQNTRKKGLSKTESLQLNSGMLFVFERAGDWGIWMKDMKFAIDIIWINDEKQIVAIAKNVPPQPKTKDKDLIVYKPGKDAKYVLEINAGLSDRYNLVDGDVVTFDLTKAR